MRKIQRSAHCWVLQFLMKDDFETPDDVAKYLGVQPLAVIPEVDLGGFNRKENMKKKSALHWNAGWNK